MEDPEAMLVRILGWAEQDARISAVVLTGSRARGDRVDRFSDLDVELIGPGWAELAADEAWFRALGEVLVVLPFDSDGSPDADPPWPTRLVVYEGGRKIDFTLAGEDRIGRMRAGGLDPLYRRGFAVLYDESGLTAGLPVPTDGPAPLVSAPKEDAYRRAVTEFWFEATQVPVYVARDDLWVAQLRQTTMREMLLTMLEWSVQTDPVRPRDTWHIGHHMSEWLPPTRWEQAARTFARLDAESITAAQEALMHLFEAASREVAERLGFVHDDRLPTRVRTLVDSMR